MTIEEVEDEDEEPSAAKKKKKKPKKKKKKPSATAAAANEELIQPAPVETPPPLTHVAPASPMPKQTAAAAKKPSVPKSPPSANRVYQNSSTTTLPQMSTTTLSELSRQHTAQSAHSYLQAEHLKEQKTKIKSRPEYGNLVPIPEKKGLFSRFGKKDPKPAEELEKEKGGLAQSFNKLGKRASTYMHQILSTKQDAKKPVTPMKWDHFLRVVALVSCECFRYSLLHAFAGDA